MSASTRIYSEHVAQQRFERNPQLLQLELRLGAARRHLDPLVELCELLVEQTGGNAMTEAYRLQLAEAKRVVASRSNLRLCAAKPVHKHQLTAVLFDKGGDR
jgi:hypothetical protein